MTNSSNNFTPTLTSPYKPSIDMVTMLFDVPKKERTAVKANIKRMKKRGDLLVKKSPRHKTTDKGSRDMYRYRYQSKSTAHDKGSLIIDVSPRKNHRGKERGYLRVEFNPNKYSARQAARTIKEIVGEGLYQGFYTGCWITRIDIAVDVPSITPNDILVYVPGVQQSKVIRGDDGAVETICCGAKSSRKSFSVYDKQRELKSKLKIEQEGALTRFEAMIRNRGKKIRIRDLAELPNVYEQIRIYHADLNPAHFSEEFMETLHDLGLQHALLLAPRTRRPGMHKKLEAYRTHPLDPVLVWNHYPAAIQLFDAFLPS